MVVYAAKIQIALGKVNQVDVVDGAAAPSKASVEVAVDPGQTLAEGNAIPLPRNSLFPPLL
jgi:hypothetical protein